MVDEAKGGKADAEKRLLDAAGQVRSMCSCGHISTCFHFRLKPWKLKYQL